MRTQAIEAANPGFDAVKFALANWAWLAGVVLVAGAAAASGAAAQDLARAVALAVAPAVAGFILVPAVGEKMGVAALLSAWLLSGAALIAAAGGALSPLTAMLGVGIVLGPCLGRPWATETGAGAVLAFALGAWVSASGAGPAPALGAFPEMLAVLALALTAALAAMLFQRRESGSGRIAEVSHELRTPLTHILGFSEMIERRMFGELNDRYAEYAGLIRQSGTHLLELVNDLLDISKIVAGRFELVRSRFDVCELVAQVIRMSTDAAAKKSIALGMTTSISPIYVNADDRAVRRMLINTVGNALKFTPEGGRVIVVARVESGAMIIETIDNGPGIPEAERNRLGVAYERGASGARAEGAGLGLSLVRAMAELHGGTLSFHDAPDGGALVRLTLPVLD